MRRRYPVPGTLLAACASVLATYAFAQSPLPQTSPFLPAAGTTVTVAQPETLEFAGVSVVSKQTLVSIYDTKDKRSRWIPVGTKSEGIEIVSYDGAHDQIVIRQAGQLTTLTLRKPTKMSAMVSPMMAGSQVTPAAMSTPTAGPAAASQPKKPLTQAQQEEEARMFVADMLDIGMQNRKAYEEAQKKAAAEKASGKSSAPPATSPSGG
ncbi:MAG TPA: hypothetical protein VHO24_01375 [Opitutaceae bacterium]|nr:hypothetical protein [Opitutaceae bacterium]